jgi:hypothetical protein
METSEVRGSVYFISKNMTWTRFENKTDVAYFIVPTFIDLGK